MTKNTMRKTDFEITASALLCLPIKSRFLAYKSLVAAYRERSQDFDSEKFGESMRIPASLIIRNTNPER